MWVVLLRSSAWALVCLNLAWALAATAKMSLEAVFIYLYSLNRNRLWWVGLVIILKSKIPASVPVIPTTIQHGIPFMDVFLSDATGPNVFKASQHAEQLHHRLYVAARCYSNWSCGPPVTPWIKLRNTSSDWLRAERYIYFQIWLALFDWRNVRLLLGYFDWYPKASSTNTSPQRWAILPKDLIFGFIWIVIQ